MSRPERIDMAAATARLAAARRVMVTTHTRADGDAIGSAAGLARVLSGRGATARVLLHEPPPDRYAFLVEGCGCEVWQEADMARRLAGCDLLVVVDTCAASQLGELPAAIARAGVQSLAIDHHLTRDAVVDAAWIDETAAACAQMVARLCGAAGWAIDAETATLLFAGLATDSGWFRFSNAGADAFAAAAGLVAAGARPNDLYERLYLNEPAARARLVGAVMASFELDCEGRLAVIRVSQEMLRRCGATATMTEDLINEPQRVGSVEACVMAVEPEKPGDPVRISLRSKRGVNVAHVASRLGGGGHERASGARVHGEFEDVVRRVAAAMREAMHEAMHEAMQPGGTGA